MDKSVARINEGKKYFCNEMVKLGFKVLPSAGNFVHVAFADKAVLIANLLAGKVLYRESFEHPSLLGFSRFSIAPISEMKQVVDLIKQSVNS
jgi:histidinol-phosphate/aromatic aminotransferase/cobyric acid decarboxylase-like protein